MFWRTHVSKAECRVAMRDGEWKIVANDTLEDFQLYHVQKDWQEKNDLAKENPEKLNEMKAQLIKLWEDIKTEGPNEWWENERQKAKSGKLNY